MRLGLTLPIAVAVAAAFVTSGVAQGLPGGTLVIRAVTLIDGTGAPGKPGMSLVVSGGRVAGIVAAGREPDAEVVATSQGYKPGDAPWSVSVTANTKELEIMVTGAGLTPLQTLTAVTRGGAHAMGVDADRGTLEVGRAADIVLLGADPTMDIENTRRIRYVIKNGRVVLDASAGDSAMTPSRIL